MRVYFYYSIHYKNLMAKRKLTPGQILIKKKLGQKVSLVDLYHAASTLGKLGGSVKSSAKTTSSRQNGKLGGRPRKNK